MKSMLEAFGGSIETSGGGGGGGGGVSVRH